MRRALRVLFGLCAVSICFPAAWALPDDGPVSTDFIDRPIQAQLDKAGVARVAKSDDAEFLRRIYLDLHGVLPTAEQAAQFLDDPAPSKRAGLINKLLDDPQFGRHFADIWRKALISPSVNEQRAQTDSFTAWLAQRFNDGDGWDEIVYDLMTATGKIEDNPSVVYLIEGRHPLGVTDLTDLTSRYFLGIRLNCAQCHDHPFAEWKRSDYWGMASFFAQIQTPNRPKKVYMAGVVDDPKMTMDVLRDADMLEGFQPQEPTFLGGDSLDSASRDPHRVALARWMTSPENPFFARAAVNRIWWHFFGRGIVNPVDDMHSANEPSNEELLSGLSRHFVGNGFDVKHLCEAIANSRTYQQTSRPGEHGDRETELFARMPVKVLTAEQLYDSLIAILGAPTKGSFAPIGGPRNEFGQFFAGTGDPEPVRYDRGIPHVLRLMNSPQFAGRSVWALAHRLASSGSTVDEGIDELFLSFLSRRPTAAERQLVRDQLDVENVDREAVYRELAWVLLMSSEFSLNH